MSSKTAARLSQDEFDALPDDFDFSTVAEPPAANRNRTTNAPELDEYDLFNELDTFADFNLDDIAELGPVGGRPQPAPTAASQPTQAIVHDDIHLQAPTSLMRNTSSGSTQYAFDEVDAAFLQEVDSIERNAASAMTLIAPAPPVPTGPNPGSPMGSQQVPTLPSSSMTPSDQPTSRRSLSSFSNSQLSSRASVKRKRSTADDLSSNKKSRSKGKSRYDPHASARRVLLDMEESLTCPICYHILVAPHVGVPCGHSYCGECGVRWMKQNPRRAPSCPCCRSKLTQKILIVPNFALEHTIEKHIDALGASGVVDWQPIGQRYREWQQRKAAWAELSAELPELQQASWVPLSPADSDLSHSQMAGVLFGAPDAQNGDSSSSSSEDESSDEQSPDLFRFFSTPPLDQPRQ